MSERASVLIVGTGLSGLGMGIRLKQSGVDDFVIAPSLHRSRQFAPQPKSWAYRRQCASRHNILPHIRDNANVVNARFHPSTSTWVVTTVSGRPFTGQGGHGLHLRVTAQPQRVRVGGLRRQGRAMRSATLAG